MSSDSSSSLKRNAEEPTGTSEKKKVTSLMDRETWIDFCDPNTVHDRILLVEDEKFYVVSGYLALYSSYFHRLFFDEYKEKDQKEIELKDVDAEDFENFLNVLSPNKFEIEEDGLFGLLKLSDFFESPSAWQKCWDFILIEKNIYNLLAFRVFDWMADNGIVITDVIKKRVKIAMKEYVFELADAEHIKAAFATAHKLNLSKLKDILEVKFLDFMEEEVSQNNLFNQPLPPCDVFKCAFECDLVEVLDLYNRFFGDAWDHDEGYSFLQELRYDIRELPEAM